MSKNTTKTRVNTSSMQLTQEQKEKFLAYLEMKGLPAPKGSVGKADLEINMFDILDNCVKDVFNKVSNMNDMTEFLIGEWIISSTFAKFEQMLDPLDKNELATRLSLVDSGESDLPGVIFAFLENSKHFTLFYSSILYSYLLLCEKLEIETNEEILNNSEIFLAVSTY